MQILKPSWNCWFPETQIKKEEMKKGKIIMRVWREMKVAKD
jgi:hypothetical protein